MPQFDSAEAERLLTTTPAIRRRPSEEEVAAALGIPGDVTQVALLPVAYTIGTDFRKPPRRPVEEITYWNSWSGS